MNVAHTTRPMRGLSDSTVHVCKTAPGVSFGSGKDGIQIRINDGWIPFWRLKALPRTEEKGAKASKDQDNFFLETKEQLTAWWLKLVEENVDAYLTQQWGFDFAAIPYDYIDRPPKSMPAIKKNLDIVHTVLSALSHSPPQPPSETIEANRRQVRAHLNAHLFSPVTEAVYRAIEAYSHGVKTYLWHECNLELDRYDFSMSELFFDDARTPSLEETFTSYRDRKDRESSKWTRGAFYAQGINSENNRKIAEIQEQVSYVESLVHEIWYIREMKKLEQGFFTQEGTINPHNKPAGTFLGGATAEKSNSSSVSDIVPISGLILSKFHRLENELKTIIEHWGRRK